MAVQQPGNTDPNGSTAVITVNGGSRLAVAGDIVDGAGISTINLNGGGTLDLQPAGDATPGRVAVDILNLTDGIITGFVRLSVRTINLLGANTLFAVEDGQAIAPSGVGTVGPLTVNGFLALRGETLMDIRKMGGSLSADRVESTGSVDLGGTLTVTFSGNTPMAAGDKFTLFASVPIDDFGTVKFPPPGPGLAWANHIFVDGSIEIVDCGCGEPTTPPTLVIGSSPANITVSWPLSYVSFALRGQTNPLTVGLSTNWGLVPGVVGNQVTISRTPASGGMFFQLFQQ
jgi:hypothetical protein